MIKECLGVDRGEEPMEGDLVLATWYAEIKLTPRCPEHAMFELDVLDQFPGTLDEVEGKQAELNRRFRGKRLKVWRDKSTNKWLCRVARKKIKKEKQEVIS